MGISQWLAQYGIAASMAVLAVVLIILGLLSGRKRYPYQAVSSLFSPAELKFLRALEKAVDKSIRIYAKVRIADVVNVKSGLDRRRFWRAFNGIACKHLDYVLCDAQTGRIMAVIELDDRSHQRPDRRRRDAFVDAVMQAAGIPILHVAVSARYNIGNLKADITQLLR